MQKTYWALPLYPLPITTLRPQGEVPTIRSDNGLIFHSRRFREACRFYCLPQEFITPYRPEQNGLIERWFRSLKEECVWQHQFQHFGEARQAVQRWIAWYNEGRPHHALGYRSPQQYFAFHNGGAPDPATQCLRAAEPRRTSGCRRHVVGLTDGGHYN